MFPSNDTQASCCDAKADRIGTLSIFELYIIIDNMRYDLGIKVCSESVSEE
jgi:hypothetical protein